jgi:transposase-like protein
VIPFFAMPGELPKVVYTTSAVESLHRSLRKTVKTARRVSERRSSNQVGFI